MLQDEYGRHLNINDDRCNCVIKMGDYYLLHYDKEIKAIPL